MRRIGSILLLLAFGALGSGTLRYLHELEHAAEHALEHSHDAACEPHDAGGSDGRSAPDHDHSPLEDPDHCLTHAQLKLPMLQGDDAPPLVCLGLLVGFLTALPEPAIRSRRPILRLHCRAPPRPC